MSSPPDKSSTLATSLTLGTSSTLANLVALVVIVIAVHTLYSGYIRPQAERVVQAAQSEGQSAPRDFVVVMKDYEQEVCLILTLWGLFLIGSKSLRMIKDRYLFDIDLVAGAATGESDAPDTKPQGTPQGTSPQRELSAALVTLEGLPDAVGHSPLVRTLVSSLRRYLITGDVQNTSDAIDAGVEALAMKQEAENSMVRYLIWAIPSIGFIGTVRGIGQALSQADQALAGDIAGMTNSLGVAFNSTLVALFLSIILMFFLHQLQRMQDSLVVTIQAYCESFLLNRVSRGRQT